ncbi:MAG: branched-chain amino acid ABC transporter permease [Candidatus Hodarchaeales archaeon]|jgi:ABC-type branched-subunit amino acid transport system permease subunit
MTDYTTDDDKKPSEFFLFKGYYVIIVVLCIIAYFILLNAFVIGTKPSVDSIIISIQIFSFAAIFGIAALSLNLEIGNTGLTNFGKVAFIMVGSYVTGLTLLFGYNILVAFIVGIIVSGFLGYLVAIPTLKLREDYLAIVTIAIGEVLRTFVKTEGWIQYPQSGKYGGPIGLAVPNTFYYMFQDDVTFGNYTIEASILSSFVFMIITLILLLIVYVFVEFLYNSPWGRILKGIRENDVAVESLGKNVVSYKTHSFIIGSGLAGFSGGLWAIYIINFAPDGFQPILTFNIWIIVIIGGLSNNRGVIVGSFLFWTLEQMTRLYKIDISNQLDNVASLLNPIKEIPFVTSLQGFIRIDPVFGQNIFFGLILILFLLYRPHGILPERPIKTVANEVAKTY